MGTVGLCGKTSALSCLSFTTDLLHKEKKFKKKIFLQAANEKRVKEIPKERNAFFLRIKSHYATTFYLSIKIVIKKSIIFK